MCFNCLNTLNSFWLRSLRSQAFRRWTRCFHCLSNPTTSWRTAAARTRQRQVTPMWRILSLIRVCRTEGCAACCGSILSGSCSMALVKMDFLPSMLLWNEIEESHNYTLQLQCFLQDLFLSFVEKLDDELYKALQFNSASALAPRCFWRRQAVGVICIACNPQSHMVLKVVLDSRSFRILAFQIHSPLT